MFPLSAFRLYSKSQATLVAPVKLEQHVLPVFSKALAAPVSAAPAAIAAASGFQCRALNLQPLPTVTPAATPATAVASLSRCCARLRVTLNRLPGIFGIWGGNPFCVKSQRALLLFLHLPRSLPLPLPQPLSRFCWPLFILGILLVLCFATICSLLFSYPYLKFTTKAGISKWTT